MKLIGLVIVASVFVLVPITAQTQGARNQITIIVDGHEVIFPEYGAVIVDGHTYVPVHGVFELMGFYVGARMYHTHWNLMAEFIVLRNDIFAVLLEPINDDTETMSLWVVEYDGSYLFDRPFVQYETFAHAFTGIMAGDFPYVYEVILNPPILAIDGRLMLPLRALVEMLSGTVEWDGTNRAVIIQSPAPRFH